MTRTRFELWTCQSCGAEKTATGTLPSVGAPGWHCLAIAPGDPSWDADWKRYLICPDCTAALTSGASIADLSRLAKP